MRGHLSWISEVVKSLGRVRLFATPWTVAYQVPLSMGFSRQECWSGLPFPSPGDLGPQRYEGDFATTSSESRYTNLGDNPVPKLNHWY